MPKGHSSRNQHPDKLIAYAERKIMRKVPIGKIRNKLFEMGVDQALIEKSVREAQKRCQLRAVQDISMEIALPTKTRIPALLEPRLDLPRIRRKRRRAQAKAIQMIPSVELHPFPPKRPSIRVEHERRHLEAIGAHPVRSASSRHARKMRKLKQRLMIAAILALFIFNPFSMLGWVAQATTSLGLFTGARQAQTQPQAQVQQPPTVAAAAPLQITPSVPAVAAPRVAAEQQWSSKRRFPSSLPRRR